MHDATVPVHQEGKDMKDECQRLANSQLLKSHPISGLIDDWCFRQEETSSGAWRVEGKDTCGRIVSCDGGDPERLLSEAVQMASKISMQVNAT